MKNVYTQTKYSVLLILMDYLQINKLSTQDLMEAKPIVELHTI